VAGNPDLTHEEAVYRVGSRLFWQTGRHPHRASRRSAFRAVRLHRHPYFQGRGCL